MLVLVHVTRCHKVLLLLMFEHVLYPGPGPGVHHMGPVLGGVGRELLPSLDNQNTGIAYLTIASISKLETPGTVFFVLLTVSKAGTKE